MSTCIELFSISPIFRFFTLIIHCIGFSERSSCRSEGLSDASVHSGPFSILDNFLFFLFHHLFLLDILLELVFGESYGQSKTDNSLTIIFQIFLVIFPEVFYVRVLLAVTVDWVIVVVDFLFPLSKGLKLLINKT